MNLEIHEVPDGHYVTYDHHKVFFLCKKEGVWCNKSCDEMTCAHTLYTEKSKNWQNMPLIIHLIPEEEFLKCFEKLYFTEDAYDWWEKEKPKQIWNCRTHEWEDEE